MHVPERTNVCDGKKSLLQTHCFDFQLDANYIVTIEPEPFLNQKTIAFTCQPRVCSILKGE